MTENRGTLIEVIFKQGAFFVIFPLLNAIYILEELNERKIL